MYESFFGMTRRPFITTPTKTCVFETDALREIRVRLVDGLASQGGLHLVTGPAGVGKTLTTLIVGSDLENEFTVVPVSGSGPESAAALLQTMLYALGRPYLRLGRQELDLELRGVLREHVTAGRPVVMLIDDAHELPDDALENIAHLAHALEGEQPLIRVLLAGQVELEERTASPAHEGFSERVRSLLSLKRFSLVDSARYVNYRLRCAGVEPEEVFTEDALESICHTSDGLPRNLNAICDHALLLAYIADARPVNAVVVTKALDDLRQLPLEWNDVGRLAAAEDEEDEREHETASVSAERAAAEQDAASDIDAGLGGHVIEVGFGPDETSDDVDSTSEQDAAADADDGVARDVPRNAWPDGMPEETDPEADHVGAFDHEGEVRAGFDSTPLSQDQPLPETEPGPVTEFGPLDASASSLGSDLESVLDSLTGHLQEALSEADDASPPADTPPTESDSDAEDQPALSFPPEELQPDLPERLRAELSHEPEESDAADIGERVLDMYIETRREIREQLEGSERPQEVTPERDAVPTSDLSPVPVPKASRFRRLFSTLRRTHLDSGE